MAEGFASIPTLLLEDDRLSAHDRLTWISLSSWLGCSEIRPSHDKIAARAGISVKSVRRSLDHLRNLGLVEWAERRRDDGGQTSHAYRLVTPWSDGEPPLVTVTTPPGQTDHPPLVTVTNEVSKSEVPKTNDDRFEEFWSIYPKRPNNPKKPAHDRWVKITKDTDPEIILAGARAYAATRERQDPQFTAQAITWLNQGRWADDHYVTKPRYENRADRAASAGVPEAWL